MTWSLRIENGDLVKGPGNSISTITGSEKVVQDLMCHIREPYGTDPLNPDLGSFIYTEEEGTVIYANGVTTFLSDDYSEMVVSEIRRIIEQYQEKQMARLRSELQEYNGLYTFSDNEIVENFIYCPKFGYIKEQINLINGIMGPRLLKEGSFNKYLYQSKLIICSYPNTAYFDSLLTGPTILFCDLNQWPPIENLNKVIKI